MLALTLFAALPLALNPGLPAGTDVLLHVNRAEAAHGANVFSTTWEAALRLSDGASRAATDGHLTYILTSGIHRLFGHAALDALRALVLACLLSASAGMYLFCQRRSGRLGAVLAGLTFVYSPLVIYTLPYARGAYPEMLALALFPLLLWRIDRLRDKPAGVNALLVFLIAIALWHSQTLMALLLMALALGWVGFETGLQAFNREASQMRARASLYALLVLLLGALACAPVWWHVLPDGAANRPGDAVETNQKAEGGQFLRIETLLSPPPRIDAGAINGLPEAYSLGIGSWILALAGGISALLLYIGGHRTRHPQAFLGALCFALLALALILLLTSEAGADPLPKRQMLAPLAVCLAIVAGMNGIWLGKLDRRIQLGAIACLIALPIAAAIPLLYLPEWQVTAPIGMLEGEPMAEPQSAVDGLAAVSMLATALLLGLAWRLRIKQSPPRPYWTAPPLTRSAILGICVGGTMTVLLLALRGSIAWPP